MLSQQSLAPNTIVAGRYRIVRELGRGGMGVIYVVEHTNTGAELAMKLMLDGTALIGDRAARFRREARASARISSEHVVKVTDADTAPELDGAPFLVMELLTGNDLERRLLDKGKIAPKETVAILGQVARALDKAHAAGVIHRDLKPENIFLHRREDNTEIVKVLDFGISKILGKNGDMALASFTSSMEVMGTPLYMAPEQARAKHGDVGPWTDVWAIGLVAMRMLTGGHYWNAESITELLMMIMNDDRMLPSVRFPELGTHLDAWFVKSTASACDARYQSVGDQVNELSMILTGERAVRPTATAPVKDPLPALGMTMPLSSVPFGSGQRSPASITPGPQPRTSSQPVAVVGSSTSSPLSTTGGRPSGLPSKRVPLVLLLGTLFAAAAGGAFLLARPSTTPAAAGATASGASGASPSSGLIASTASASASASPLLAASADLERTADDAKKDAAAPVSASATATTPVATSAPTSIVAVKVNAPAIVPPRPAKSATPKTTGPASAGDPFDTQK